jgi:hypothetical protein
LSQGVVFNWRTVDAKVSARVEAVSSAQMHLDSGVDAAVIGVGVDRRVSRETIS